MGHQTTKKVCFKEFWCQPVVLEKGWGEGVCTCPEIVVLNQKQ